eukprot:CAMPEP_0119146230 /NCGR_PEP_ID=MMETSP1310-20130426/38591_1 /TAXON_ID=464262 /ORGANISM="Genus nov. species nov., Strain RCC2339" /LENGTH=118 /DNA_ID=CAMNT_0007138101 /DNA_START=87 /DNA_END=443 /DNA_ORIENTATION=+
MLVVVTLWAEWATGCIVGRCQACPPERECQWEYQREVRCPGSAEKGGRTSDKDSHDDVITYEACNVGNHPREAGSNISSLVRLELVTMVVFFASYIGVTIRKQMLYDMHERRMRSIIV